MKIGTLQVILCNEENKEEIIACSPAILLDINKKRK